MPASCAGGCWAATARCSRLKRWPPWTRSLRKVYCARWAADLSSSLVRSKGMGSSSKGMGSSSSRCSWWLAAAPSGPATQAAHGSYLHTARCLGMPWPSIHTCLQLWHSSPKQILGVSKSAWCVFHTLVFHGCAQGALPGGEAWLAHASAGPEPGFLPTIMAMLFGEVCSNERLCTDSRHATVHICGSGCHCCCHCMAWRG